MQPIRSPRHSAVPGPFWSDLRGYLALAAYCFAHIHVLRGAPYRDRFLRLFLDTGSKGGGAAGLRAVGIGTLVIAFMVKNLSTNAEIAVKILAIFVVREIGPLLAAVIVLMRTGTVIAAQLSVMRWSGEVRSLRLLGLPVRDYLALPAVFGIALATMVVTFYFQVTAVAGGIAASALLLDLSIREMLTHLALALTPVDVAYTALKSLFFGFVIGTVSAYHGLRTDSPAEMPETLSRSVMQSLFVLLLFNAVFAYLVYGMAPLSAS